MKTSVAYKLAEFARRNGYDFKAKRRPEVIAMQDEIDSLEDKTISFQVSTYDDGSWSAISTNLEGLITGGRNQSEVDDVIKDAVFTYFGIPPQYCDDKLLRPVGRPVNTEREVLVTT